MISSREIKEIRSLSTKKGREETGLFAVEGEKMVSEALASDFEVVAVYRTEDIGIETMKRISSLSSPSPVLAVVKCRESATPLPSSGLHVFLDSIRDPGNLGTILRIADWFGAASVVASPDTVDFFNPKTVQSTMGAIFRVPFRYADIPSEADAFRHLGGIVYGTFLDGENIYSADLLSGEDVPVAIVIGNESRGISPEVGGKVASRLLIPPFPGEGVTSESLNAAVATAITLSEFRRRIWAKR